ncbi:MAG TPA: VOC family protein [Candidatus Binataceae bacterium]|nr:VOC family protein [Candidatus Binataceae bacterium]
MGLPNGVHHLAICTKDIKKQIEYFSDVVGMELVALYWMHGVENTFHGFMRLSDSSSIAFVQHPDIAKIQPIKGVSHAGTTAGNVAPGTVQHIALNVDTLADLLAIRDRVRSRGHWIMGPIDHGFCKSIYLAAPEGIMLEFSTSEGGSIDAEAWIDPEVMALAGINREEVERYKHPAAFESKGGAIPQPTPDPSKPLMAYKPGDKIWTMSDEQVLRNMSVTTPPVQPKPKTKAA